MISHSLAVSPTMSLNSHLLLAIVTSLVLFQTCAAQYRNSPYGVREDLHQKKPYQFNEAEMTAIQAIMAFRDVIGELLSKVGFNIPGLASIITRSDMNQVKTPVRVSEPLADSSIKSGLGSALLRGVALSLPLLIPMATQIRRMSAEPPYIPPIPFIPDPYYDKALHRRRGKRSVPMPYLQKINQFKQLETILRQIEDMRRQYDSTWYADDWYPDMSRDRLDKNPTSLNPPSRNIWPKTPWIFER